MEDFHGGTDRAAHSDMYLKFKEVAGHTLCAEIQKILYGESFKLYYFSPTSWNPRRCLSN